MRSEANAFAGDRTKRKGKRQVHAAAPLFEPVTALAADVAPATPSASARARAFRESFVFDIRALEALTEKAIAEGRHCRIEDWAGIMCPKCRKLVQGMFYGGLGGGAAHSNDECLECVARRHGLTVDAYLATLPVMMTAGRKLVVEQILYTPSPEYVPPF